MPDFELRKNALLNYREGIALFESASQFFSSSVKVFNPIWQNTAYWEKSPDF